MKIQKKPALKKKVSRKSQGQTTAKTLQKKAQSYLKSYIHFLPQVFNKKSIRNGLLNLTDVYADVHVVSDKRIQELNALYRAKNTPTDVLSFMSPIPILKSTHYLGEIVIAVGILKKQAQEMQHSILDELQVLICHGLIHLLGYDHEKSKKDAQNMAKLEAKLLQCTFPKTSSTVKNIQTLIERNL